MTTWRAVVHIDSPQIGGRGVNVWHFSDAGSGSTTDKANEVIDALEEYYQAIDLLFNASTVHSFDGIITEVTSSDPDQIDALHTWSHIGGTSTQNLPPANCLVAGWRTGTASRSGRGRTFHGPLSQDVLDNNGTPKTTVLEAISDAQGDLITTLNDPTGPFLGVWSPADNVLRRFTGGAVRDKFAVLRSRRD